VQAAVICSKTQGLLIRVRSGGHDYEGLSYLSEKPFIIIDFVHFQEIALDIEDKTAWVQAGATVGQVYYRIAEQSSTLGFPAGVCPTTAVGGHISGGGLGFLMRKYGLAADNILDALFIDVNGKLLDRKSMGEDLFWALRGGGGASFGVIVSWKIKLVSVPSVVTVCNVYKTLEQGATSLFYKWQNVAHEFPEDLFMRTVVQPVDGAFNRTIQVLFQSLFLGSVQEQLPLMEISFPELGLEAKDCTEMRWISSVLKVANLDGQPAVVLLNRSQQSKKYFKGKSDFVKEPISITELESIWKVMLGEEISPMMICDPFGGMMDEILESAIPFPHRVGNLYTIQYLIEWKEEGINAVAKHLEPTRRLYNYTTPYVSKSPRSSYFNYKDLDLGMNRDIETSYLEASVWGKLYFKNNFERLASVKSKTPSETLGGNMSFIGFAPLLIHILLFASFLSVTSVSSSENIRQCLSSASNTSIPITNVLYSQNNYSYSPILDFSIQNLMFISFTTPKPLFIITPLHESHIQAAVICSRKFGLLIRVRSGGHDYEGLSYISYKPFIIIDLVNFQQISVHVEDNSAWVQAGATVGQVYYQIAEQTSTHGFPAGVCPTMGVGGHISGGGLGFLMRKYGLAADNVLDAIFIDVNGQIYDRKSMSEDLFWAIRGGGGASFGVIVAWKIKLAPVPSVVTYFNVPKRLEQGATSLFYKWQKLAPEFHEDLLIRTVIQPVDGEKNRTIEVVFESVFLGTAKEVLSLMEINFPEFGLDAKDCTEMSWINSTLSVAGLSGMPVDVLLNRSQQSKRYFKGKSDFVQEPISIADLERIWTVMLEQDISPMMICEPFGGKMDVISESSIPFPHRIGNLYNIQYYITWQDGSESTKYLEATRRLYGYMTPYVSQSPRASYVNYKDLELGINQGVNTSYLEARVWGEKYFKSNFLRLANVKSKVDPENFFWNEQSIPLLPLDFLSTGRDISMDSDV
ncbi:hypothetical protein IFM89_013928, partial [Coptis chinensis]